MTPQWWNNGKRGRDRGHISASIFRFAFDDANRQLWEEQTVFGFPTRRVETPRDADGLRRVLHVPGFYQIQYDYTQRGQLRTIFDGAAAPWVSYSYDLAGNMTKRQNVYGGVNDSTNIIDGAGVSQYDALNRPTMWEQSGVGNQWLARSHFNYDNLGRLTASWRDEQQNRGEWFDYEPTGSLKEVAYNADEVWNGTPLHATRRVTYTMTPDTLNRSRMDDTGVVSAYTPNALNQYQNVAGGEMDYDGNFNLIQSGGFSASYDAMNRLISAQSSEDTAQFVYDGLGRCLKRKVSWETILIAYDGWKPIVEWDEWGYRKAWNLHGDGPDEILWRYADSSGHLRYHRDRMGNVAFLLDFNGTVVEKYTYDAFGQPTMSDVDGGNPRSSSWYGNRFMFTGREYFPELGLYDYRNRLYHPILGRFLQTDPIGFAGGDANLFRYCGADPVNWSDPFGLVDDGEGPNGRPPIPWVTLNGITVHGFYPWPQFFDGAMDWGPTDQVMHYFGGGDHGWSGGGFRGLGDGPLGGGLNFSLGPPLPPNPYTRSNSIPSINTRAPSVNLPTLIRANIGALNPPAVRVVLVLLAYPRAHEIRSQGHELFPRSANSAARHQWGSRTLANEVGATTARDLGLLNEVQGFLWYDLWMLDSRLSGQTDWAFQAEDLLNNEIGIWQSLSD